MQNVPQKSYLWILGPKLLTAFEKALVPLQKSYWSKSLGWSPKPYSSALFLVSFLSVVTEQPATCSYHLCLPACCHTLLTMMVWIPWNHEPFYHISTIISSVLPSQNIQPQNRPTEPTLDTTPKAKTHPSCQACSSPSLTSHRRNRPHLTSTPHPVSTI